MDDDNENRTMKKWGHLNNALFEKAGMSIRRPTPEERAARPEGPKYDLKALGVGDRLPIDLVDYTTVRSYALKITGMTFHFSRLSPTQCLCERTK